MSSPLEESIEATWPMAFAEARFPAFIVDREGIALVANLEGQAWMSRNDIPRELQRLGAPKLPLEEGRLVEQPPQVDSPGLTLLGLESEVTLVCLGSSGQGLVVDYVRLFRGFLKAEQLLKRKNERLEVYHELLTHDAPNYITAVYGYLQMIQAQELPPEKLKKYIDTSVRQTEALNHLIDNARALRQLEVSPLGTTEPLDLRVSIDESIAAVRSATADKPSEIQWRPPPGTLMVYAEPGLAEVFKIILMNAVRYADSPQVSVDVTDEDGSWHLRFNDNGRGIPDDKKEFLFMRFDRLDKQKKIRGSGLSLALARALVERHGGRIWVENRVPGDSTKGSVFHVLLPKA